MTMSGKKRRKKIPQENPHEFVEKPLDDVVIEDDFPAQEPKVTQKKASRKSTKKQTTPKQPAQKTPKKKRSNKKEHEADIQDQLTHIYQNDDGSLPDMSQFIVKKRNRFLRAVATLVIAASVLGGVAWFGFFVYQPQATFSEESVVLSISGEDTVVIGKQVRYRVRYRNAQQVALHNAVLEVRYPDGFVFESASVTPLNEQHDQWNLGELAKQESGFIDIFGTFYDDIDSAQSFRLFLTYTPTNFNGDFQKVATQSVTIDQAPVSVFVEPAETVVAGVEVPIVIRVTNETDEVAGPMRVLVQTDSSFSKTRSEPESDSFDSLSWTIDSLEPKETTIVTLYGSFSAANAAQATVLVQTETEIDGRTKTLTYAKGEYSAGISEQATLIQTIVNGSSGDFSVQPGENLSVRVTARNNGDTPITNGRIRVVFDSPSYQNRSLLDWLDLTLVSPDDAVIVGEQLSETIRRGSMTWDIRQVPALRSLEPGEEVTIDFTLPVQDSNDTTLANFDAYTVQLSTELAYDVDGTPKIVTTNPSVLTVNSDLTLSVEDIIANDGTTHTVTWGLSNSFHALKDITLSADIFGDTVLDESTVSVPAGDVTYNQQQNTILWNIDELPLEIESAPLVFTLLRESLDETQTQLMSKIKIEATDAVTGQIIRLVGDELLLESTEE